MKQDSKRKNIQKILVLLSGIAFMGSTVFGLVNMLRGNTQSQSNTVSQQNDQTTKLENQEKGFEEVLKREPKSRFALQGLFETRLAMYKLKQDKKYLEKTLEPLDKLITLYPNESGLKILRDEIKKQLATPQKTPNENDKGNNPQP